MNTGINPSGQETITTEIVLTTGQNILALSALSLSPLSHLGGRGG